MSYAIMRLSKVKTMAHVAGLGKHIERERETRNADSERTHLNERLAGSGDWHADVERRLAVAPKIRKNAVLAVEHVLTASPEFFAAGSPQEQAQRRDAWRDASMAWLRETYGADNVVAAVMHRDETTPHIQALVVPIDSRGHLNARQFIGGDRTRLAELQTSYAEKVAPLGLERGIEGSVATHQEVKRWYAQGQEVTREVTQQIATAVEIEPPQTVVARPREYARQQHDRVVASVAPQMEALAQKAEHLSHQVERQELQIAAQAQREQMSKAMLAHLRQVNLGTVMTVLGGEPDRDDRHTWHLGGEVISINGEKFWNHTRQQGGGGAIDLVMHAQPGYGFKEAVAYLRHQVGADVAVVAAARHAQSIAEREPAPPFRAPEADSRRWAQVRAYLTEQRCLPKAWVDALHDRGVLYADRRGNAVFLRQNDQGEATGACLRGTWQGSTFTGLAAGTRRDAGWFRMTWQRPGTQDGRGMTRPVLILAESPIDALSALEIERRSSPGHELGPVTVMSTDGAGALPHQAIRRTLDESGIVRVATDNDQAGERIWQMIQERYPEPGIVRDRPVLKDWNDVLRHPERTMWEHDGVQKPGQKQGRAQRPRPNEREPGGGGYER